MVRRLVLVLTTLALAVTGCSEPSQNPVSPDPVGRVAALSSSDIDLNGVLSFAQVPNLEGARHAERLIRAAEGGSVELNGFRVVIPAGALPADMVITIDLPTNSTVGKHLVAEFGPHGTQFQKPVTLVFPLKGVNVPSTGAGVARWENGAWTPLGGAINADRTELLGTTPHFSVYSGHVMAGG